MKKLLWLIIPAILISWQAQAANGFKQKTEFSYGRYKFVCGFDESAELPKRMIVYLYDKNKQTKLLTLNPLMTQGDCLTAKNLIKTKDNNLVILKLDFSDMVRTIDYYIIKLKDGKIKETLEQSNQMLVFNGHEIGLKFNKECIQEYANIAEKVDLSGYTIDGKLVYKTKMVEDILCYDFAVGRSPMIDINMVGFNRNMDKYYFYLYEYAEDKQSGNFVPIWKIYYSYDKKTNTIKKDKPTNLLFDLR